MLVRAEDFDRRCHAKIIKRLKQIAQEYIKTDGITEQYSIRRHYARGSAPSELLYGSGVAYRRIPQYQVHRFPGSVRCE